MIISLILIYLKSLYNAKNIKRIKFIDLLSANPECPDQASGKK